MSSPCQGFIGKTWGTTGPRSSLVKAVLCSWPHDLRCSCGACRRHVAPGEFQMKASPFDAKTRGARYQLTSLLGVTRGTSWYIEVRACHSFTWLVLHGQFHMACAVTVGANQLAATMKRNQKPLAPSSSPSMGSTTNPSPAGHPPPSRGAGCRF